MDVPFLFASKIFFFLPLSHTRNWNNATVVSMHHCSRNICPRWSIQQVVTFIHLHAQVFSVDIVFRLFTYTPYAYTISGTKKSRRSNRRLGCSLHSRMIGLYSRRHLDKVSPKLTNILRSGKKVESRIGYCTYTRTSSHHTDSYDKFVS